MQPKKPLVTPLEISDAIEQEILNSEFEPGAKLDESSLSKRFGVSRTPIREALRELSARGLIKLIPNRGAFLVELSASSLIEMFEVMGELEGMCGRLAARRITPQQMEELVAAQHACREAETKQSIEDYYAANVKFHDVILAACQNQFLADELVRLHRRLRPYHRLQFTIPHRITESLHEHDEIVTSITAGDENKSQLLLRDHVLIQGKRFHDFIALMSTSNAT